MAGRGRAFIPYLVQVVWAREARSCPYPPLTLLHQKESKVLPYPPQVADDLHSPAPGPWSPYRMLHLQLPNPGPPIVLHAHLKIKMPRPP